MMKHVKLFENFNETNNNRSLAKDLKQMEKSLEFFKNSSMQTQNDKDNIKFYEDIISELKKKIEAKKSKSKV